MKITSKSNKRIVNILAVFCCFFMVTFVAVFLYAPISGTHAESDGTDVKLHIGQTLSAYVENDVAEASIRPGDAYGIAQTTIEYGVETNNIYGFTVTMGAKDDKTYMESATTPDRINSIASKVHYPDVQYTGDWDDDEAVELFYKQAYAMMMDNNTWSYRLENSDGLLPIPTESSPDIIARTSWSNGNYFSSGSIGFIFRVSPYLSAGVYERDVVLTAYVNGLDDVAKVRYCSDDYCSMSAWERYLGKGTTLGWYYNGNDYEYFFNSLPNNYIFAGWYTEPGGGGVEVSKNTVVNGDLNIYPKFEHCGGTGEPQCPIHVIII